MNTKYTDKAKVARLMRMVRSLKAAVKHVADDKPHPKHRCRIVLDELKGDLVEFGFEKPPKIQLNEEEK